MNEENKRLTKIMFCWVGFSLIYFFMFVILKMDFKDKSNEIYVYHLKVTGIYDILGSTYKQPC